MIIRCSECGVQYRVDENRISDQTRIFRCGQCGEILHHAPSSEMLATTPANTAVKPQYILISCPDCRTKYRLSAQRMHEGKSGLRCRNCDRIIPLHRETPARSLKVQVIRTDQPEGDPSAGHQPVFQTYSAATDTKRKQAVIFVSAAAGLVALIVTGIFWGYPLLFSKHPSQHTLVENQVRSAQAPAGAKEQPFFLLEADLPALRRELKRRFPNITNDPRWRFVADFFDRAAVRRVKIFIYPDPETQMLPVLVLEGNEAADMKKPLLHSEPGQRLFLPAEDNSYRFSSDVLKITAASGFPAESYRIWFHTDWAVCAPRYQSQLWQDGIKRWHTYSVIRFSESIEKPIQLAGLAARIPENLPQGWTRTLIPDSARRGDPEAGRTIDAAGPFLILLDGSIKQIVSMAGVFRFVGKNGRSLQYAQQFRSEVDGIDVFNRLQAGSTPHDRTSISAIISKLLHHDRFYTSVELLGSRLTVDLQWQSDDDQILLQSVVDTVFGTHQSEGTIRP